jgi:hypothetical protein
MLHDGDGPIAEMDKAIGNRPQRPANDGTPSTTADNDEIRPEATRRAANRLGRELQRPRLQELGSGWEPDAKLLAPTDLQSSPC